jgi:signal transduction histidine kinase/ligand-binding sensor domain-containing protein
VVNLRFLLVASLLLAARGVCAQDPPQPLSGYASASWTVREGAPSFVQGLAQTQDGTLWVGGETGLFQFDGIRFKRFKSSNEDAVSSQYVSTLTSSANGDLWIGFQLGGVAHLEHGALTSYSTEQGLPRGTVYRIVADEDGSVWIATTGGIGRFKEGHWEILGQNSGLPAGRAWTLFKTRGGVLWTRIEDEVFYKPPGQNQFVRPKDYDQYSDVMGAGLAEATDGTVWAIGSRLGLRPMSIPSVPWETSVSSKVPLFWQIFFDRHGALWYLANGKVHRILNPDALKGLANSGKVQHEAFGAEDGLASAIGAFCFLEDREGNLWFGTSNGITRLAPSSFKLTAAQGRKYFALAASPADTMLWAQDRDDTHTEVVHYQKDRIDWRFESPDNLTAAYRDHDGTVWFGGLNALWTLQGKAMSRIEVPHGLRGFDVQALLRDNAGVLWYSVKQRGVFRYADGQWLQNAALAALPQEPAFAMAADGSGRVWLAYANARVGMVDKNIVRIFTVTDGLADGNVTAIAVRDNRVWVGSANGLSWFDGNRFVPLRIRDNEVLRDLWGIIETEAGDLWTTGTSGVAHLTPPQVSRAMHSGSLNEAIQMFGVSDGLPGAVQALRPTPALVESGDGKLWFAFTSGMGYIDPKHLEVNSVPPPVQITALLASGREYSALEPDIQLPKGTSQLRLPYTAYSFVAPERVHFKYRLEGVDRDWQDAGNRREATYTNVQPGRYMFRVLAANEDGVWNEKGDSLTFTVLPAFYQTAWFVTACALCAGAALFLLYRLRLRQVTSAVRQRLEERLLERERIARELHDTLLQGLQGLILRFQAGANLIAPQDPARKVLEGALARADQVLIESRNHVKELRTSATMRGDLPSALARVGEDLSDEGEAAFSLVVEGSPQPLHPILKEEAFLIGREAITNAFRHARASKIEVELSFSATELRLRVRDDGRGIPDEVLAAGAKTGHWGLPGMRERAEKVRARLEIWSRSDAGTEVQLTVTGSIAYRPENRHQGTSAANLVNLDRKS